MRYFGAEEIEDFEDMGKVGFAHFRWKASEYLRLDIGE